MRLTVIKSVGRGQILKSEARRTIFVLGPIDPIGTQCTGQAQHVDNVPT